LLDILIVPNVRTISNGFNVENGSVRFAALVKQNCDGAV